MGDVTYVDHTVSITPAFLALPRAWDAGKRFAMLEGSTRSGKTIAIIQWLIGEMNRTRLRTFAGRHDGTTCQETIVQDFQDVMVDMECWEDSRWNKQQKRYDFPNGSTLKFGGTQYPHKLHGQKQDILWLNEVMEVNYDAFKQLNQRTRRLIICDWNPSVTQHWVFTRVLSRPPEEYEYHHSTFKDNPYLTPAQVAEILAYEPTQENRTRGTADDWHWQVYGLGKRAGKEGRVFKLWELVDDWPPASVCIRHGYGLDFGFSADPAALVECALYNDFLYLRTQIYERDLLATPNVSQPSLPSISGRMEELEIPAGERIYADSARPDLLPDLQTAGWNVVGAKKGEGSVLRGLDVMRRFRIRVPRGDASLQGELENYTWDRKQDGTWLEKPIDDWNHAIDAARYWCDANLKPEKTRRRGRRRPAAAQTILTHRRGVR